MAPSSYQLIWQLPRGADKWKKLEALKCYAKQSNPQGLPVHLLFQGLGTLTMTLSPFSPCFYNSLYFLGSIKFGEPPGQRVGKRKRRSPNLYFRDIFTVINQILETRGDKIVSINLGETFWVTKCEAMCTTDSDIFVSFLKLCWLRGIQKFFWEGGPRELLRPLGWIKGGPKVIKSFMDENERPKTIDRKGHSHTPFFFDVLFAKIT